MKSHITVLLEPQIDSIENQLVQTLEPYRLDDEREDDEYWDSLGHHWDYWVFYYSEGAIKDEELATNFPNEESWVLANTSYVKNLPTNFSTSGIIDLQGKWTDMQDFGWYLLREPSQANSHAFDEWKLAMRKILLANQHAICVEIKTHC